MSSHSVRTSVGLSSLPFIRRGKVRDLFEVDGDHLLLVATDRISAFDCGSAKSNSAGGRF